MPTIKQFLATFNLKEIQSFKSMKDIYVNLSNDSNGKATLFIGTRDGDGTVGDDSWAKQEYGFENLHEFYVWLIENGSKEL